MEIYLKDIGFVVKAVLNLSQRRTKMASRIEIAVMWNGKLEIRTGDLTGSTTGSNFTKEEVLSEVSDEIDNLLKEFNTSNHNNTNNGGETNGKENN